jgi:hypothetical protein
MTPDKPEMEVAVMTLDGYTTFDCTKCGWTETVPTVGVAAAEIADAHHPEHKDALIKRHNPSPRLKRPRQRYLKVR